MMDNKLVVITGTSTGIGKATANLFISKGYPVAGIDTHPETIKDKLYTHYRGDVADLASLPVLDDVAILINNAGVQNTSRDIEVNLKGVINSTNMYMNSDKLESILNMASVSAHNGAEFGEYCASKGGVLAYTKFTAKQLAPRGIICNSLSFGGVLTELNAPVTESPQLWEDVMNETPLRKWATPQECAEWIYFMTVINKSCTGQDIIIDNGEFYNHNFIWE